MKRFFVRMISLTLSFMLCGFLSACQQGINLSDETGETGETREGDHTDTMQAEETTDLNPDYSEVNVLKGKKVLIIGNSYVFYGKAVLNPSGLSMTQQSRSDDVGYFYQLCKVNGADVSVTNWTFGGHGLADFFGAACSKGCGVEHERYLTDPSFDYVIASPGGGIRQESTIATDFENIIDFFTEANPNVKIVCLANLGAYGYSSEGKDLPGIYTYYKTLADKGVMIADWGGIVKGILDGTYTVEGATQTYSKKSFIVKDGYHPNPLTGYIASLVAYCTITGEKAEGQPYGFYDDTRLHSSFNMRSYIASYYNSPDDTNFTDVFASEADMKGIQKLVDWYLANKPYLSLTAPEASPPTGMLTARPTKDVLSVVFSETAPTGNGWIPSSSRWSGASVSGNRYFSGLRGDKDLIASLEGTTVAGSLTEIQKEDIGDIGYGLSIIGLSHMAQTKYATTTKSGGEMDCTSLLNLVNGHYGSTHMAQLYFDNARYTIQGEASVDGAYTALITLNFGSKKSFNAIGYAATQIGGLPIAQDVFVSDDGVTWTKVDTACYTTENTLMSIAGSRDPWYNNQSAVEVLFSMNEIDGKYIRIGIVEGATGMGAYDGFNVSELLVFGSDS